MKHITDIIVYKNRCEVIQSYSYTEGDIGAPHLRMIFDYMFERDSLKGLTLECKYILPSGEYSIKNVEITEDKEVLFPIYYSVFESSGWTTLKATLVDENNRITLDDIVLRVKKLNTDNVHENKQFDNMLESEVKIEVQTITDAIKKEIDDYATTKKNDIRQYGSREQTNFIEFVKSQKVILEKESSVQVNKVTAEGDKQIQRINGITGKLEPRVVALENKIITITDEECKTLLEGEIIDNLTSTDKTKPLSANQGKVLDKKIATETSKNLELLKGSSGIKDVFYIQDVGTKEIGKGYVDKITKELYICLVENEDTDIKLGKFELATNIENRYRLMRVEQKIGMYQYVYGIKELSVSRDENSSSPVLTYTQK